MTLGEVFKRLAEEGRIAGDEPGGGPGDDHAGELDRRADLALAGGDAGEAPWYVHLFVGFGTWIGAVVAAFFLSIIGWLDDAGEAGVTGALLFGAAMVVARRAGASVLGTQLTWVLAIGAQAALLVAASDLGEDLLLVAALLQVVSFAAIPLALFRWVATVAGVTSLAFWLAFREIPLTLDLLVVAVTAACLVVWLHDSRICAGRGAALWRPLAFGLPVGLAAPLVLITAITRWGWNEEIASYPLPVSLALVLLGFWILAVAARGQGELVAGGRRPELVTLFAVGLLAVVALTHEVPGIVASFLLLALSHLRRDRLLEGLALAQLALFLTLFYYSLDTPLLHKSLWIALTGVVLLALAGILRRLTRARGVDGAGPGIINLSPDPRRPLLAALLLALSIAGASILHKEYILARGRTVLLELRPVDPRSLMQGDYMALSYALERQLFEREERAGSELPRSGKLVLELDAGGVARLVGDNRAAQPAELLLTYRIRNRSSWSRDLRLGAESFFFEEGSAELYASARYGELRVAPAGTAVLVGLRDAERRPLGHRLHNVQPVTAAKAQ